MNDEAIEKEIQEKGLTAPRVTKDGITAKIASVLYMIVPGSTMTVCAITVRNGFVVTGESAAASPENFDKDIGRKIAYDNAFHKLWALEGYLLKEALLAGSSTPLNVSTTAQFGSGNVDPTDTQAALGQPERE